VLRKCRGEIGFLGKLNKAFVHVLPKFLAYLVVFLIMERTAVEGNAKLWNIIKYAKQLTKNEGKPCQWIPCTYPKI